MAEEGEDDQPVATRPPRPGAAHVPELDGIRGLAVLGVMIFHQTVMNPVTSFDHQFVRLAGYLNFGVDLFFVLSGFLITGILFDSRPSPHYYRNFYARRSLRIVPLYYAVLFLAFVVVPQFPHPKLEKWGHVRGLGQVWYWLFLSNWSIALGKVGFRHGMIDLSWTLSIEEQFYLTWPLVVRSLTRRRLMHVCLGLAVFSTLVRLILVVSGATPVQVALLTPARMDALGLGAWVALASRGGVGFAPLVKPARWLGAVAGLIVALMIWDGGSLGSWDYQTQLILYPTMLAITFAALLTVVAGGPKDRWFPALLRSRFLTTFGTFSYALYLFHNPVQAALRDTLFRPTRFPTLWGSPVPGQLLFYVAATIPAVGLAWLSWHLYEKPWLRLKRFFPATEVPPPAPVTVANATSNSARATNSPDAGIVGPIRS